MAELIAGPVIKKIAEMGFEYLKDQGRWQTGMKEELQRLRDLHPQIQAVVDASNLVQIRDQNPALDCWLWQLKDVVEEADDLLDEFEYLKHKEKTKVTKIKTVHSIMKSIKKRSVKISKRALQIDPTLKKLKKIVPKLDIVSAEVSRFLTLFNMEKEQQHEQQSELFKTRETGSSSTDDFIGRRDEVEEITQWLSNSSYEDQSHITSSTLYKNISFLSIVGHGGMGKTTLSRHVYNKVIIKKSFPEQTEIEGNEFDAKMWVCVSPNFDDKKVIAGMFESLKSSKCGLDTFEGLQQAFKSELGSKKFLLVLDDIWEGKNEAEKGMNKVNWEKVFSSLANGSSGSKILVTTRMGSVASMIADVLSCEDQF